jgi:hypothetical protein
MDWDERRERERSPKKKKKEEKCDRPTDRRATSSQGVVPWRGRWYEFCGGRSERWFLSVG